MWGRDAKLGEFRPFNMSPSRTTTEHDKEDDRAEVLEVHDLFWQSFAGARSRYAVRSVRGGCHLLRQCGSPRTRGGQGAISGHEPEGWTNTRTPSPSGTSGRRCASGEHTAWVEGDTCWMSWARRPPRDIVRQTTIPKFDNDRWLVAHVHGSDPDYRFAEGSTDARQHHAQS